MKRFAAFYDDGVLMSLSVAEGPKGSGRPPQRPRRRRRAGVDVRRNFLKTI